MEWLRMSAAEYRKFRTPGKAGPARATANLQAYSSQMARGACKSWNHNKYNAKKVEINGVQWDSKKEYARSLALEQMLQAGEISQLQRQVKFTLQEGYKNNKGKNIRPIYYIADFVYFDCNKAVWVVEDVKGSRATLTDVYKLKKKLFEYKYPEYFFVEFM